MSKFTICWTLFFGCQMTFIILMKLEDYESKLADNKYINISIPCTRYQKTLMRKFRTSAF